MGLSHVLGASSCFPNGLGAPLYSVETIELDTPFILSFMETFLPDAKNATGESMDFEWCFGDPESSPMSCEPSPVFQMDWEPALPRDTIESNGCFQEFEDNQSFTSEHFSDDPMDFEWSFDVPDPSPMSCEPPPAFQMDWEPSYINNHHNINPTSNLLIQQSSLPSSLPFQPEPMDTT